MPKGGGGKGAGAKAAKAAHQEEAKASKKQQEEDAEAKKWEEGSKNSKGNKQEKAEKAAALKAAKAERDRLLEEETKSIKVAKPKEDTKTSNKQSGSSKPIASKVPEYSARNIDDALDLLELISDDEGNAEKIGAKAAKTVDAHPERRFKAAFETYKEQELPSVRKEHPGLRLQQYHELLFKKFQKHPNNPYNQVTVSYDATKGDKVEALKAKKKQVEDRLKAE